MKGNKKYTYIPGHMPGNTCVKSISRGQMKENSFNMILIGCCIILQEV